MLPCYEAGCKDILSPDWKIRFVPEMAQYPTASAGDKRVERTMNCVDWLTEYDISGMALGFTLEVLSTLIAAPSVQILTHYSWNSVMKTLESSFITMTL